MHLTHFIYSYMAMDHSAREETCCCHTGYSFRLATRVRLYASSHRQDNTYHSLCYTSRGVLAGTRNSSIGPLWGIDPTTHCTMIERSYNSFEKDSICTSKTKKEVGFVLGRVISLWHSRCNSESMGCHVLSCSTSTLSRQSTGTDSGPPKRMAIYPMWSQTSDIFYKSEHFCIYSGMGGYKQY